METNRVLGTDLPLENDESQDIRGGRFATSVSVDGVGTVSATDQSADANVAGLTASANTTGSGYSAGAKAGSTRASTSGKKPRARKPKLKKPRMKP